MIKKDFIFFKIGVQIKIIPSAWIYYQKDKSFCINIYHTKFQTIAIYYGEYHITETTILREDKKKMKPNLITVCRRLKYKK